MDGAETNMTRREIFGIGVIGTGGIFGEHAAGIASIPQHARLIAASDLSAARLRLAGANYCVPFMYTDHRRMLQRDDIDLVVVATPPNTHERMAVESLEAGKAVLCEKPLAHTLASADRIIEVASRHPGKLCVSHQLRYGAAFNWMRRVERSRKLGELKVAYFERLSTFGNGQFGAGWWGRWDIAGGGMLITQCLHQLDLMIQLYGQPIEAQAAMSTEQQPIESEDTFEATVRFAEGASLKCSGTLNAKQSRMTYRLSGTKGVKEFIEQTGRGGLIRRVIRKGDRIARRVLGRPTVNEHGRLLADYIGSLRQGREAPIPPQDARKSLELCTAIYSSAIRALPVSLPLGHDTPFYNGISLDDYQHRPGSTLSQDSIHGTIPE